MQMHSHSSIQLSVYMYTAFIYSENKWNRNNENNKQITDLLVHDNTKIEIRGLAEWFSSDWYSNFAYFNFQRKRVARIVSYSIFPTDVFMCYCMCVYCIYICAFVVPNCFLSPKERRSNGTIHNILTDSIYEERNQNTLFFLVLSLCKWHIDNKVSLGRYRSIPNWICSCGIY